MSSRPELGDGARGSGATRGVADEPDLSLTGLSIELHRMVSRQDNQPENGMYKMPKIIADVYAWDKVSHQTVDQ